jgi:hypothetical protein
VFLDIEKAFDTNWHFGLQSKLSTLQFSISLIKLIGSFLSQRKLRVSVKGEIFKPSNIQVGDVTRFCPAKGRIFINMLYVRNVHLTKSQVYHKRQTHLLVREDIT